MLAPARGARGAVLTQLQASLGPFLDLVAAAEYVQLPPVRSWLRVADYATVPEEQTPACYVTSGAATLTDVGAGGGIDQWVDVVLRVVFVVADRDRGDSEDRAALYCEAARYCLEGDVTLGGQVTGLRVTAWAPAGAAGDATAIYRAVHDLAVTVTVPTTRTVTADGPPVVPPIHLQLDRLEP